MTSLADTPIHRPYGPIVGNADGFTTYLVFRGYAAGSSPVSRASGNRSRVCWSG